MIYNCIIFTDLEETMVANNDTNNVNNETVLDDIRWQNNQDNDDSIKYSL